MTATITREQFLHMFFTGGTLRQAADTLLLTEEEMGATLLEAAFNKADRVARERDEREPEMAGIVDFAPPPTNKIWCSQCDRLVARGEAVACWSKFCSAKAEAA